MYVKDVMRYIGCNRNTVMKYKREGKLSAIKDENGKLVFREDEVRKIVAVYDVNVEQNRVVRHDKKNIKVQVPVTPKVQPIKQHIEERSEDGSILNDYGKSELMRATLRLKEMGIYDLTDKGVLNRYAIAIQMQNKYLNDLVYFDEVEERILQAAIAGDQQYEQRSNTTISKLYEMFTKQVTHYEKALGLTPESMTKLNPPAAQIVDEMENFLNG